MQLLLLGCSQESAPTVETLASAIRAVGYPCAGVVDSSDLEIGDSWRVACEDQLTYTAQLTEDGSICVAPVLYVDSVGPSVEAEIGEQCVAAGDI